MFRQCLTTTIFFRQEIWRPRGRRLVTRGHLVHAGQRFASLWRLDPEGTEGARAQGEVPDPVLHVDRLWKPAQKVSGAQPGQKSQPRGETNWNQLHDTYTWPFFENLYTNWGYICLLTWQLIHSTSLTCLLQTFHSKEDIIKENSNRVRLEPMSFWHLVCALPSLFLTWICISPIAYFAPIGSQYSGGLAVVIKNHNCSPQQHYREPVHSL